MNCEPQATGQKGANIPNDGAHPALFLISKRAEKQARFIARKTELRKDPSNCTRCCKPRGDEPGKLCARCREYHRVRLRIARQKKTAARVAARAVEIDTRTPVELARLNRRVSRLEKLIQRVSDYSRERYAAGVRYGMRQGRKSGLKEALKIVAVDRTASVEPADIDFCELAQMSHKYMRSR